jgi:hypothetical protein
MPSLLRSGCVVRVSSSKVSVSCKTTPEPEVSNFTCRIASASDRVFGNSIDWEKRVLTSGQGYTLDAVQIFKLRPRSKLFPSTIHRNVDITS